MEPQNEHLSLLIDLLPKYRQLNSLYQRIAEESVLKFDEQCQITDFYNKFKDEQVFEKAVLNLLLSTDKEKQEQVVVNLRTEISKNIGLYATHRDFFDRIDTLHIYTKRQNPIRIKIEDKQKDANKLWQELTRVRNSLESASWNNDKIATDRLTREEERLTGLYKKEQEKLETLYQQQKESDTHASLYIDNQFGNINKLGCSFISLLDNYYPIEKGKTPKEIKPAITPGLYFDMKLVSLIHNECNNIQFENLTEVDFYAILNLQPTNARLSIKSGEKTRMSFLIYKLYEYLKTDNKKDWRTAILEVAGIDEKYYNFKYKEPESEIPSRKSESFAQRINRIFE